MSVWLEPDEQKPLAGSMVDVAFKIECQRLPADHAAALTGSLCTKLSWLKDTENTGVHPIHVAGSQNGWQRPEVEDNEDLFLSKRTRLRIRIASTYADKLIDTLNHSSLSVDGYTLNVLEGQKNTLQHSATLFSRYTVYEEISSDDEAVFTQHVIQECEQLGFAPTKLLCGKTHVVATDQGNVSTRSVLLADVPVEKSLTLQDHGLGDFRLMGCGLLIPHKDTAAVS